MYILFTYELIEAKITDQLDQACIVIDQQSDSIFKVISNGKAILELFTIIKKLDIKVVSYTAKNKDACRAVYSKLDPEILQNWIFIDSNRKKYPGIFSNRAFRSFEGDICFGEGLSQASVKGQLRLATHSALRTPQKSEFIIIEKSPQEAQSARKQKYPFVVTGIPSAAELEKIYEEAIAKRESQIGKDIETGQYQQHDLMRLLEDETLIRPKVMFFNELKCRTPNSKSISSVIIKNKYDNRLYIQKTEKTKEVGGEFYSEQLENIELASEVCHFCRAKALPHYRNISSIRYSLIPVYQKKKANVSVKPFIENLRCIGHDLNGKQELQLLVRENIFRGKHVKGLGSLLLLGLVCGESYNAKSFLEQVGYFQTMIPEMSEEGQKGIVEVYRFDFHQAFSLASPYLEKDTIRISENLPQFPLKQLNISIIAEIKQIYLKIRQNDRLFHGLFNHHKWQFSKSELFKFFIERVTYVNSIFNFQERSQMIQQKEQEQSSSVLPKLIPIEYSLLVGENYEWFTRKSEYYFDSSQKEQSQYVSLMRKGQSFELHTPLPQLQLLLRWIARKWALVQYFSLLQNTKAEYINLSKKMRLQADSDKKNRVMVLDHCELEPQVVSMHRPVKTIFITRLRRVETENLPSIMELGNHQGELLKSQEELFRVLVQENKSRNTKYQLYESVILTWIESKADSFAVSFEECLLHCKKVAHRITINRNRLAELECRTLYCLPVEKSRQRIYFIHDIYEFMRAKHLIDDILEGKWAGKLEVQQLQHFSKWIKLCPKEAEVKEKLLNFITIQCKSRQEREDSLQLLKILTETIFLPNYQHYTYNSISHVFQHEKYYLVQTKTSLFGYQWGSTQSCFNIKGSFSSVQILGDSVIVGSIAEKGGKSDIQGSEGQEKKPLQQTMKNQDNIEDPKICFQSYQLSDPFDSSPKGVLQTSVPQENCRLTANQELVFWQDKMVSMNKQSISLPNRINNVFVTVIGSLIIVSSKNIYEMTEENGQKIVFEAMTTEIQSVKYHSEKIPNEEQTSEFLTIVLVNSSLLTIIELVSGRKIEMKHPSPVACACMNFQQGVGYSLLKRDDVLLVWDLGTCQIKRVYHQVEKSGIDIFARNGFLVIRGHGYVKKIGIKCN